jgi:hypothetical protein
MNKLESLLQQLVGQQAPSTPIQQTPSQIPAESVSRVVPGSIDARRDVFQLRRPFGTTISSHSEAREYLSEEEGYLAAHDNVLEEPVDILSSMEQIHTPIQARIGNPGAGRGQSAPIKTVGITSNVVPNQVQNLSQNRSSVTYQVLNTPENIIGNTRVRPKNSTGFRVPSELPKFRGKDGIKEVDEFLNRFGRVCQANKVPQGRFASLLLLCMEDIDAGWLERWIVEYQQIHNTPPMWINIKGEFLKHF